MIRAPDQQIACTSIRHPETSFSTFSFLCGTGARAKDRLRCSSGLIDTPQALAGASSQQLEANCQGTYLAHRLGGFACILLTNCGYSATALVTLWHFHPALPLLGCPTLSQFGVGLSHSARNGVTPIRKPRATTRFATYKQHQDSLSFSVLRINYETGQCSLSCLAIASARSSKRPSRSVRG